MANPFIHFRVCFYWKQHYYLDLGETQALIKATNDTKTKPHLYSLTKSQTIQHICTHQICSRSCNKFSKLNFTKNRFKKFRLFRFFLFYLLLLECNAMTMENDEWFKLIRKHWNMSYELHWNVLGKKCENVWNQKMMCTWHTFRNWSDVIWWWWQGVGSKFKRLLAK